jgi:hypothetical protein
VWQEVALGQISRRWQNERRAEGRYDGDPVEIVCECGQEACHDWIALTAAAYEDVRRDGAQFVVARDHAVDGVDRLLERHRRFDVVEAIGDAAEVARNLDPRAAA